MLKAFLQVDLFAGLAAAIWAITALFVVPLASLCSSEVAFAFSLAALARGIAKVNAALGAGLE